MVRIRQFASVTLGLALAAGAFGPAMAVDAQAPITLRLASPDVTGRASEGPIRFFADEVARESGGSITIEPVFDVTSDDPNLTFEQYAADRVKAGEYELGVIASRGWDKTGITTPWALQAPFLIDNDALAVAVATGDPAQEVLDGMAGAGVTGLSLWPEDLRHPFAFAPFGRPFLSPDDFRGTVIRAIPSHVGWELLSAMGATPMVKDGYGRDVVLGKIQGAESGLLQGATLVGQPTATGNVTFFPKFEILVANSAAYAQLSDEQRSILASAAIATRDQAITERPTDAQAGRDWCDQAQGRVALASDAQVGAFQAAAAPIYAELEADPAVKAIIDDVRALKAQTPPSPSAAACVPKPRETPPTNVDTTPATQPPAGTYRATITEEDLLARGLSATHAADNAGTVFLTFEDGTLTMHWDGDSLDNDCHLPYELHENVVRVEFSSCWEETSIDLQWRPGADGDLDLTVVNTDPTWDFADDASWFGRTWTRVE